MGPIWGRQDPVGPNVGPMNFAIWVSIQNVNCEHEFEEAMDLPGSVPYEQYKPPWQVASNWEDSRRLGRSLSAEWHAIRSETA